MKPFHPHFETYAFVALLVLAIAVLMLALRSPAQ